MFFNQQGENRVIRMFGEGGGKPGIVINTYNSKLGRLRQEENKLNKLKVILGYIVRPCLKSHKRKEKPKTLKKNNNHDVNYRKTRY